MLRCIVISLLLVGCASAPDSRPVSAPVAAEPVATAQAEPVAAVADEPETEPKGDEVTKVFVESEAFQYSMTLRRPGESEPRIMCSHGKRTGSHAYQKYCRTTEDAIAEREAAREFFDDARRRGN